VETIEARSIFSQATGYIRRGGFRWTCNPYLGCTFGCSYCYAMFLPQNRRPRDQWGRWLVVKRNAIALAEKHGCRVADQPLYMSSVTDPYVPAERTLGLTRGILQALVAYQPRLLVQTRSPLVARDSDVLACFARVRVHMTIPTDCERIRSLFEPKAPPLRARWQALQCLKQAGLPVGICLAPLLPVADVHRFAETIARLDPQVVVVQDFHDAGGKPGADTGDRARHLLRQLHWTRDDYQRTVEILSRSLVLFQGEAGFFPPA